MFSSSHTRHAEGRTASIATDRRRRRMSGGTVAFLAAALLLAVPPTVGAQVGLAFSVNSVTVPEDGSSESYGVSLDKPLPTGTTSTTLTLTLTQPTGGDAVIVNRAELTFTNDNYQTYQYVKVTGIPDDVDNANDEREVAIAHSSADVTDKSLRVLVTDDDTAGLTITPKTRLTVYEEGTPAYFDVKLNSAPATGETLTVRVTAKPTGIVIVNEDDTDDDTDDLVFDDDDWDKYKQVRVSAVSEQVDNPNDSRPVTIEVDPLDPDPTGSPPVIPYNYGYNKVATVSIPGTVIDDDTAELVISTNSVDLPEGDTATSDYQVKLGTNPSGPVTVAITSKKTKIADIAATTSSLTFQPTDDACNPDSGDPGRWCADQPVDVTSMSDDIDNGDRSVQINHVATGGGYDDVMAEKTVTIIDNDAAGLTLGTAPTGIVEGNTTSTDTITVSLASDPTSNVTVTVRSSDATKGVKVSTADTLMSAKSSVSLKFTPGTDGTWDDDQTVHVFGLKNGIEEGFSRPVDISFTARGGDYSSIMKTATVTVSNGTDSSGLSVDTPTVTETTPGRYTVGLASEEDPGRIVTVAVRSSDATKGVKVSTADTLMSAKSSVSLKFTPGTDGTWDDDQTVHVFGVDNDIAAHRDVIITHSASGIPTDHGTGKHSISVSVINVEDAAVVTIDDSGLEPIGEKGGSDTYKVKLNSEPTANVIVDVNPEDPTIATVRPQSLTFTPGRWKTPISVRVTGVNDDVDNLADRRPVRITHAVKEGSATEYIGAPITGTPVSVTVLDDDADGFTVTPEFLTISRGREDTFTVKLNTEPVGATVTVDLRVGDPAVAEVSPANLTFTRANWNIPQVARVMGKGSSDTTLGGERETRITIRTSTTGYDDATPGYVEVTVTGESTAPAGLTVTPSALTISAGETGTYTVRLNTRPRGSVTVTAESNEAAATVSPRSHTFTRENWDTARKFTVTGVAGSASPVTITNTARGGGYEDVTGRVSVTVQAAGGGLDLSRTTLTVTEASGTGTYTVALEDQPTGTVTVAVTSDNPLAATVSPPSLSFTLTNWSNPQTVTVTGEDDQDVADGTATITHRASGGGYDNVESVSVAVTVKDDDTKPTLSRSAVTVTEAAGTSRTATYTLKLAGQPTGDVAVTLESNSSAATVSPTSMTFTTANWNTPQTITVTAVDNQVDDGASSRTATITHTFSGGGFDGVTTPVTVTVTDDDELMVSSPTPAEIPEAGGTATYTVKLSSQPASNVTVAVASSDTDAATVSPPTLTFTSSDGTTAQTVTVTGFPDDVDNAGDKRSVTITNTPSGYGTSAETKTVTVTVKDDDVAPAGITLSVVPSSVDEDAGATRITVTATVDGTTRYADLKSITLAVGATSDSAKEGTDYQTVRAVPVLRIPAGAASGTRTFTLTPIDDSEYEGDEFVTVAGAVSASVPVAAARVTLREDDPPPTELSISGSKVDEGAADTTTELEFTVSKVVEAGKLTNRVVTVGYAVTGGTAQVGTDYEALSAGTLTFQPADTSKTIMVTVKGDNVYEGDETIEVTLSSPTYATLAEGKLAASGTIMDDDAKPEVSIAGDRVDEGDAGSTTTLTFTVTKAGATSKPVTVDYAVPAGTRGGTAEADADYQALQPGKLTFQPDDESSKTITVTVMGDNIDEINETVRIALSDPTGATLSPSGSVATGIIVDDDDPPVLSIAGSTVTEGHAGATATLTFTVTKTGATSKLVTVAYADADSGTATAGTDYEELSAGTLTFQPDEMSKTIPVTVKGDNVYEDDETVEITLSKPSNATLAGGKSTATATGTITDDDDPPALSISGSTVTEGHEGTTAKLVFTVTKTGATSLEATVAYADAGSGTATAGTDYVALRKGKLTFQPADTSKTITVTVKGDNVYEGDETVEITLSDPTGATLARGKSKATGTITDDDVLQTVARDWMARFGRTAAAATVDAIATRMNDAASVDVDQHSVTLAGRRIALAGAAPQPLALQMMVEPWEDAAARGITLQDLAEDSAFDLGRSFAEGYLSVWGASSYHQFESAPKDLYKMDGNLVSAILGADHAGDHHVAGLALAYHGGGGEYGSIGNKDDFAGELEASLFSFHPYVRLTIGDFHVGGSFGAGTGAMNINPDGGKEVETGVTMTALGAVDARYDLSLAPGWLLAVQADAQTVHMVSAEKKPELPALETATNSVRLGLETSYAFLVGEGMSLAPTLEAGLRHDGGDAETGFGLDAGGGLRFTAAAIGLMVDAHGSAALSNWSEEQDQAPVLRDWGIGGVIRWRPDFGGHGPEVTLAPAYGGQTYLNAAPSLDAVVGYRLPAFGGILTPYSSAEIAGGGPSSYSAGARFLDDAVEVSAEGTHRQPTAGDVEQFLTLRVRLRQ